MKEGDIGIARGDMVPRSGMALCACADGAGARIKRGGITSA